MIGKTLGHYEIIEQLGAGGMGEVYLAHDTTLKRDVAIKVLPEELATDPERLARLEREATAVAALDHPNIVTVFSVEEAGTDDGGHVHFITMQLVEGKTLSELTPRNGFPLEKFFDLAIPLTDAISAAHARGIIHRDLKPSNVMVSDDGRVRVLDFGLAKLGEETSYAGGVSFGGFAVAADSSEAPTGVATVQATSGGSAQGLTEEGKILGTVAYMSPEQAEGKPLDHRTDIFSLGIILYEMATGERPFQGDTNVSVISSIVKETPTSVTELDRNLPRHLGRIIKRTLTKDVEHRFQTAKDLRNELEGLKEEVDSGELSAGTALAAASRQLWRRALPWSLAALAATTAIVLFVWGSLTIPEGARAMVRTSIVLPPEAPLAPAALMPNGAGRAALALSPDGSRLVYVAQVGDHTQLYQREMATGDTGPIDGTAGGYSPFFSPDGRSVGFFGDGKLKKVGLTGGSPIVLANARNPFGGTWGTDDTIYFNTSEGEGISKVSATPGEEAQIVTRGLHLWPEILPSDAGLLLSGWMSQFFVVNHYSPTTDQLTDIQTPGFSARYAPSGHIVYANRGKMLAAAYDASSPDSTGSPEMLFEDLRTESFGGAQFTFSQNGLLVYASGTDARMASLVWVDHQGNKEPLGLDPARFSVFDLSLDGRQLAVGIEDGLGGDIWVYDTTRGTQTRLTTGEETGIIAHAAPRWHPDGRHVAYASTVISSAQGIQPTHYLSWVPADRSRDAVRLTSADAPIAWPDSFSPDGTVLAFSAASPETGYDLWLLRFEDTDPYEAAPLQHEPLLRTRYNEAHGRFSPDGNLIAYMSDESGRYEIYVARYPGLSGRVTISIDGGMDPLWTPNGRELFYHSGSEWFAADVTFGPEIEAGRPRRLFEGCFFDIPGFNHDISPDDQRFLVLENPEHCEASTTLTVVEHFFDELVRRVPRER